MQTHALCRTYGSDGGGDHPLSVSTHLLAAYTVDRRCVHSFPAQHSSDRLSVIATSLDATTTLTLTGTANYSVTDLHSDLLASDFRDPLNVPIPDITDDNTIAVTIRSCDNTSIGRNAAGGRHNN